MPKAAEGLAEAVHSLEARRDMLRDELETIERRLGDVASAVLKSAPAPKQLLRPGATDAELVEWVKKFPPVAVSKASKASKADTHQRWFVPGEPAKMIKAIAAKQVKRADVVRGLINAKTKPGMTPKDRMRLQWAAQSAVNAALVTKVLVRRGKFVQAS